jgi:hypothetical protein
MREYVIRNGSMYSGIHYLYENESEFKSKISSSNVKLHKWAIDDFRNYQVGDYVIAEDGYVVQILAIKEMKSKKERKGKTIFIRFPMGTFAVYEKADGSAHYPRFYAQFTTGDKGSASGKSRSNYTGAKDEAKKRFANLIFSGIDNRTAYRLAFNYKRFITNSQIDKKISDMMRDKLVIEELKNLSKPVQDKIINLFSVDKMIIHLESLLNSCKKGSAAHRENLRFILKLKGLEV